MIRCAADLEMAMNAVERINFYSEVDIEDYDGKILHHFFPFPFVFFLPLVLHVLNCNF